VWWFDLWSRLLGQPFIYIGSEAHTRTHTLAAPSTPTVMSTVQEDALLCLASLFFFFLLDNVLKFVQHRCP